jgi:hypothetical protein
MAWDLSQDEQSAVMAAVWAAIQPWWLDAEAVRARGLGTEVKFVEEDGVRMVDLYVPRVDPEAPEEILALAKVHGDIVSRFGVL